MAEELYHYGMPRRSGRYPWGSGDDPYQNAKSWQGYMQQLKAQGLSEVEIARGERISVARLRARDSIAKDEIRMAKRTEALRLSDKGMSNTEIGRQMALGESSVRSLLDPIKAERTAITKSVANMLKSEVDQKKYVDVGAGVENYVGVARTKLNTAVTELQEQGYQIHRIKVTQQGLPDQFTEVKVLGAPGTEWKTVVKDPSLVQNISLVSEDSGRTFSSNIRRPVQSISSDRIKVQYGEEGKSKDGVIELRRGVQDLDMGGSQYAQVRIGVDDTHFLKGMAIYNDNMPKGVDVIFNTNKVDTGNKLDAMKPMVKTKDGVIDPDNPFKATIKENGQRGALNIVNEEGDWATWSKTLSSQMLSKQTPRLAKSQLDLAVKQKQEEHDEITALTNPVIKKQLLMSFADDCDASAVHLKAAGLPRQASKVILPVPDLSPNEIYAPTFNDGETVVLIRHPHGGTFEIPQVTVNNRSPAAKAIMENAPDAIGIHPKVAQRLSGADFDGDTVIVIPNNRGLVRTSAPLKGLENFDPIESYRIPEGSNIKPIKPQTKQNEMGKVSNLITDMTIKGANTDEIARAVRHSMVVIDSEKHNLDYRQSYKDNGIASLSEKYQGSKKGGASTIVSLAKSTAYISTRKPRSAKEGGPIDPITGEKVYTITPTVYTNKQGKVIEKKTPVAKMTQTKDALSLSSGRQVEIVYAGYANEMKSMANESRKTALSITPTPYSPSARKTYENEVSTLTAKLNIAQKNAPLERQAQIIANSKVARKQQDNPDMDADDLKKARNQALAEARITTGAGKDRVNITDKEWEAIQAGAVTTSKLTEIIQNANLDQIKALATPRSTTSMTPALTNRAKGMLASGATLAEVADALGVSTSTISKAIK